MSSYSEYHKKWYANNKRNILTRAREKEKITCDICNRVMYADRYDKHLETEYHLNKEKERNLFFSP